MEDKYKKYYDIMADTGGLLQVSKEWAEWLRFLDEDIRPKTYVEIGIEYGASLATINKLLPDTRLIGVDLKHPNDAVSNEWKDEHHDQRFEFIKGDSHDIDTWKRLMMTLNGKRADVLFIDGAHFFEDVYRDWKDYAPMAKIVALHDITWSPYAETGGFYVHFLWEYLKTQYSWKEIKEKDSDWGGIGIVYLDKKLGLYPLPTDFYGGE